MTEYKARMQAVLELAQKGAGHVAPNPMVAALIVRDDIILGSGYHQQYGQAHAEVNAIQNAYDKGYKDLQGASMFVNLEPCSHVGKTPPCCKAIEAAGIQKVIVAMRDPNPLVSGKGIAYLQACGIQVIEGVLEKEAKVMNEAFIHHILEKTPFVTMKTAMTLDGKIATATGDSKWISSPASRQYVHELRQVNTGIMVGIETLIKDDARLTTRLESESHPNLLASHAIPIIVDSRGRIPLDAEVIASKEHDEVIVATTAAMTEAKADLLRNQGCSIYRLTGDDGRVDLQALMLTLGARGINSILLEGGGTLNYSALQAGIVHKLISFIAPKIVGGSSNKTAVEGCGLAKMSDAIELKNTMVSSIDKDVVIEGYICLQD